MPRHILKGRTASGMVSAEQDEGVPHLAGCVAEWAGSILRWLHVVAGIAWIGSSFYFIHLDLSLKPRPGLPDGVKGDEWQVHGGGFYHMMKYLVAPAQMPDSLTWFKWEAYTTWMSGFALLVHRLLPRRRLCS